MQTIMWPHNRMRTQNARRIKKLSCPCGRAINCSESRLCGLCACIICMQVYFSHDFKPEKTQPSLFSAPMTAKFNFQSIPNFSITLLSCSHPSSQSILDSLSRLTLLPIVSHFPIIHHMRLSSSPLQFLIANPNPILSPYPHSTLSPSLLFNFILSTGPTPI